MGFCAHGVWWINKWVKTLFLFNIRYNFFSAFFLVWFCFEETVLWRRFMYLERFILLRWQKNYASPRLKPNASAFIITLSICTLKMTPQPSNRSFVSIFLHIYQQRKKAHAKRDKPNDVCCFSFRFFSWGCVCVCVLLFRTLLFMSYPFHAALWTMCLFSTDIFPWYVFTFAC